MGKSNPIIQRAVAYFESRNIKSQNTQVLAYLGLLNGLTEEQLDIYTLNTEKLEVQDELRLALQDGIKKEELQEIATVKEIKLIRKEYARIHIFPEVEAVTKTAQELIEQLREQRETANRMLDFLKDHMEKQNQELNSKDEIIKKQQGTIEYHIKEEEELKKNLEELHKEAVNQTVAQTPEIEWKEKIVNLIPFLRVKKETSIIDYIEEEKLEADQIRAVSEAIRYGLTLTEIKRIVKAQFSAEKIYELINLQLSLNNKECEVKGPEKKDIVNPESETSPEGIPQASLEEQLDVAMEDELIQWISEEQ